MVERITGTNGSGKTSLMVQRATEVAQKSNGSVVFIDCSNSLNYVLPSSIRLINADDFNIFGATALYGFLSGICACNYDITDIFIDSALKIIWNNKTDMDDFTSILNILSDQTGVVFHLAYCDTFSQELTHEHY